ncbi:MAG TPA: DUF475 domain-containing protein [Methylomirabilota bacterium]|nr:DUF475 domain-containing protein [Methylomirabilota bacterium]
MLRAFGFSVFITIAAIIVALLEFGSSAALTITVLIAIEIAFSFDNAILNAKILERLSKIWQQLFLTVGMVFAIVGMRFVFPILIVMVTANLPWSTVINDALHHPQVYSEHLEDAHAAISAFGGAFLLTLTLYFLFDDARKELWLKRLERQLQRFGGSFWLPPLLAALVVGGVAFFASHEQSTILQAGIVGVVSYAAIKLLIDGLSKLTGSDSNSKAMYTGWAAFLAFMYLQILDASFSFDGVLGAFAITDKVLLIALGLGVGAIWVRSLTVYLVRHKTLNNYKYLEHGAHYAILVLAVALLGSIFIEVPDAITGIVGLGVIGASFISSREAMRAKRQG